MRPLKYVSQTNNTDPSLFGPDRSPPFIGATAGECAVCGEEGEDDVWSRGVKVQADAGFIQQLFLA